MAPAGHITVADFRLTLLLAWFVLWVGSVSLAVATSVLITQCVLFHVFFVYNSVWILDMSHPINQSKSNMRADSSDQYSMCVVMSRSNCSVVGRDSVLHNWHEAPAGSSCRPGH